MLRPFCRSEHNGHTCHRMLGHGGPHIERHHGKFDENPDVRWFDVSDSAGEYTGLRLAR